MLAAIVEDGDLLVVGVALDAGVRDREAEIATLVVGLVLGNTLADREGLGVFVGDRDLLGVLDFVTPCTCTGSDTTITITNISFKLGVRGAIVA